jgi:hypothetical protein
MSRRHPLRRPELYETESAFSGSKPSGALRGRAGIKAAGHFQASLLLLLRDLAGLLRSLLHCALRFLRLLSFLSHSALRCSRWLIRCVHSGIEMHCIPNTPTQRKKQRPLKEVLTQQSARAARATIEPIAMLAIGDAKSAGEIDTGICQACRKRLCGSRFRKSHIDRLLRECHDRESRRRRKAACVDSESRVLAMKKFSCLTDLSVAAVSQNRFFGRIATRRFGALAASRSTRSARRTTDV